MNFENKILEEFVNFESRLNGEKNTVFHSLRKKAIDIVKSKGLPTLKHEEWKYTNLAFLNKIDFALKAGKAGVGVTRETIKGLAIPGLDTYKLVTVNGVFDKEISDIPQGAHITVLSLSEVLHGGHAEMEKYLGGIMEFENNTPAAINTALSADGIVVRVEDKGIVDKPVEILNFLDASDTESMCFSRNLVVAGKSSHVKFIERCFTLGNKEGLINIATEIFVEDNADVEFNKMQYTGTDKTYFLGYNVVSQGRDSRFTDNTVTLSGAFVRNDLQSILDAENIESHFNGLYYVEGKNFVDNHTKFDHAKPHSQSNEFYKGILTDKGTGVFNGKILVRQDAQKTNAYQSSKCLLLSDDAKINAKPELEIYADDVKCSHGASTGSLDEDSLFYLKARGIGEDMARSLLLKAYAMEVIDKMSIRPLAEFVAGEVDKKIGTAAEAV